LGTLEDVTSSAARWRTRCRLAMLAALSCGVLYASSCCPAPPSSAGRPASSAPASSGGERHGDVLRGDASYYASFFNGRMTSNGERYDPRKLTAANRTLPFGTRLRVTRLDTGRSVEVRVNDRGPFGKRRRILDLSRAAAEQLDMIRAGHAEVEAVVLE
jgi:rare lipoprotein A